MITTNSNSILEINSRSTSLADNKNKLTSILKFWKSTRAKRSIWRGQ